MKKSDFYYELPKELIAQTPLTPRDASRLLVYDRGSDTVTHKHFFNITEYLKKGDLLVINNTKVLPARLYGNLGSGAKAEVLLLKRINTYDWECIARPAKKFKAGTVIFFSEELSAEVIGHGDEGIRILRFMFEGIFEEILGRTGNMPLPPYITEKLADKTRYQTVYGQIDGSAAAPTAGLHFTPGLLEKIRLSGVEITEVLLHVGLGTFRPVKEDDILAHKMHSEYFEISEEAAEKINRAKSEGRRVVAVGTTSVRVLESASDEKGRVSASKGNTEIFIYPPYKFKVVDALLTNFHLPESTLIMLVSAFCGREKTMELYGLAVEERYRFFSFGDAMLLI